MLARHRENSDSSQVAMLLQKEIKPVIHKNYHKENLQKMKAKQ
jgi:hypothetical protein